MEFRRFLQELDRSEGATAIPLSEADPSALLGPAEGVPVRMALTKRYGPEYKARLAEAARFMGEVYDGRRRMWQLTEALGTGDFPLLFADIIDRQMLAAYQAPMFRWADWVRVSPNIRDFRTVKRFRITGGDDILQQVGEQAPYPESSLAETQYTYSVSKFGRDIPISFEAMINDDLDAFRDLPTRLARAVQRSEARFVTALYVDSDGPHDSLYAAGYSNVGTGVLNIANLTAGLAAMTKQTDPTTGEPILIEGAILVVPQDLEITALQIVRSQLLIGQGADAGVVPALNILPEFRLEVRVDPYIGVIATSNGDTSWFLFGKPTSGAALEMGFLRGRRNPDLLVKQAAFTAIGGAADQMGLDETDTRRYRVRHVFGGTRLDPRFTYGSDGTV